MEREGGVVFIDPKMKARSSLDGESGWLAAFPYGLQHVLAMFVANVTPVMLIAGVAVYNGEAFTAIDTALLIQAALLIAGIGTLLQL